MLRELLEKIQREKQVCDEVDDSGDGVGLNIGIVLHERNRTWTSGG